VIVMGRVEGETKVPSVGAGASVACALFAFAISFSFVERFSAYR